MLKRILLTSIFLFSLSIIASSQNIEKETLKEGGIENKVTITQGGMYNGTKSKDAKKYFDKAAEYEKNRDYKKAKKYYLKAIKKDSKYVEAYDNIGLVYRRLGEYEKAIKYYKKSIDIYPSGMMAHQNLAVVYGIKKEYNKAINEYKEILKFSPEEPEGYFGIANSYMMLSKFDDALVNAKKALALYEKLNSHHIADGYYLVGLINYYKGDDENARLNLKIAKEKGARINQEIEKKLFGEESYQLKTEEDYSKYESEVIDKINWLLKTPLGENPKERQEINTFLLQWMVGSPKVSLEITENIVTYVDCADCLMIFMGGWVKYALETKDFDNKLMGNLEGTKSVIKFYKFNKKVIGENKAIEKLIKLEKKNKLEEYIKSNI